MRPPRRWLLLGVLALPAVAPLRAADPAPEAKTGLKVGTKAPAFTLKDQAGQDRSLDEFLKAGKVALVFHRSADW
jgi:cytochrome oxidase Cu insertion factor (SCO1/SenC/PrrC family)